MVSARAAAAVAGALAFAVAGCGGEAESARRPAGPAATLVSVVTVQPRDLEVIEHVVGSVENVVDPSIGAEVAGRVLRVLAYTGRKVRAGELLAEIDPRDFEIQARADAAEIARLESLLAQQERVLERQEKLVAQGFISRHAADEALAQRNALRESLAAARARAEQTRRNLDKTRVTAPVDGVIEVQIVAPGDFVKVGDPLFRMVGPGRLRARLPLPENADRVVRPGLRVRLSSPAAPERELEARIGELRPTVVAQSRALEAIVRFENDGAFRGGGSVNAKIVTAVRAGALMVPEQAVVLRPAGKVVYVLAEREGRLLAEQRPVQTGVRQDGAYEIVQGLAAGERVVVDGAGFLTHGAPVTLARPRGEEKDGAAAKGPGRKD
jgi:RND family efflux transporter MFP subunit